MLHMPTSQLISNSNFSLVARNGAHSTGMYSLLMNIKYNNKKKVLKLYLQKSKERDMCEKVINFDRIGNANILNSEHYIHGRACAPIKELLRKQKYIFQSNKNPAHSVLKIKRIKTHEIMFK